MAKKITTTSKTKTAKKNSPSQKTIEPYEHKDKQRLNNPPVGLVNADSEPEEPRKTYAYDPHLDPTLQWAGKAERTSFDVPTVNLHVHERIDARTIIEAVRKQAEAPEATQLSLFAAPTENPPLREAIEFYQHRHNWSNRLIAGDSLLVMNSLLEREGMGEQVQMIYIDPPYGIKYGSNFQPFVNKRDVKDGKDEDLNQEPEMVKAFRDTWELGIHSYLAYLRDRILLARELLNDSGSIFVQISDENVHRVRDLLDEVFGAENHCRTIIVSKTSGQTDKLLASTTDYLLWYAKNKTTIKYRQLFWDKSAGKAGSQPYQHVELPDGTRRRMTPEEYRNPELIPPNARIFRLSGTSSMTMGSKTPEPFSFEGRVFYPEKGRGWSTTIQGLEKLSIEKRLQVSGSTIAYVRYLDDFPVYPVSNYWHDTGTGSFTEPKVYVVQTGVKIIERCALMTTDPGDLVFDPTCGSGTTAYVAEQWGRRWITCDTSRVAITLAKQRLMTSLFDYYELAHPSEGVGSGFKYETVPHVTLKSIANNEPANQETLYDKPIKDKSRARVTGPFTMEAVPAPTVRTLTDLPSEPVADSSIARTGETLRQSQWREELYQTGIRAKGGQSIAFTRVEPLTGTRWLHADAETKEDKPQRVVISFGSAFAPLEQKQVEFALDEAAHLVPKPKMVVFAAFQFDAEASKDIDEAKFPGVTLLKAQMNTDLLTDDLKKKRSSNESFWLIGQPDARLVQIAKGEHKGKYQVEVKGFDYYNPRTGQIESGGVDKIAVWMLDTEYDQRALFPRQVFFPMSGEKDGWSRLARNLKAEIDEDLIEAYRGNISLPFESKPGKYVAVKIVDDRGIESLKIIEVE
jgi:adenine-specific DNA-methyltransferase